MTVLPASTIANMLRPRCFAPYITLIFRASLALVLISPKEPNTNGSKSIFRKMDSRGPLTPSAVVKCV